MSQCQTSFRKLISKPNLDNLLANRCARFGQKLVESGIWIVAECLGTHLEHHVHSLHERKHWFNQHVLTLVLQWVQKWIITHWCLGNFNHSSILFSTILFLIIINAVYLMEFFLVHLTFVFQLLALRLVFFSQWQTKISLNCLIFLFARYLVHLTKAIKFCMASRAHLRLK